MRHLLPTLSLAALAVGSLWSVGYAAAPGAGSTNQLVKSATSSPGAGAGLTVIGRSQYTVTAARAEIRLELKESDELAGAALEKLTASSARLSAAAKSVESGTVTVTGSGPRFGAEQGDTMQMMMMNGMDESSDEPPKVQVSETFLLKVSAPANGTSLAALVAEVLEAAADAGATLAANNQDPQMMMIAAMMGNEPESSEPAVTFYTADDDSARLTAMVAAMADATAEAEMLAGVARRELGPVESLRAIGTQSESLSTAGTETRDLNFEVRFGFK